MGRAIAEVRESRRMSKGVLAAKADLAPSTIRRIERGETEPQWGTLRRVAKALQIPLDVMVKMAEEPAPRAARKRRTKGLSREGRGQSD